MFTSWYNQKLLEWLSVNVSVEFGKRFQSDYEWVVRSTS